ncbi:MAG: EFR1 family ferrodoxin, partial [Methanomassiliicoccaceae archaeon]|nr:EFR1 family ferrodoxin [Methanomassiliicoccaceae archaeon]
MIFYFSATGNSRYAAERLAEILDDEAMPIQEALKNSDIMEVSGTMGIVIPVYFLGVPTIVSEFITKLKMNDGVKVFSVFTYGGAQGSASKMLKKEFLKTGIIVTHSFEIRMPENYVPKYKVVGKEKQDAMLKAADEKIDRIP